MAARELLSPLGLLSWSSIWLMQVLHKEWGTDNYQFRQGSCNCPRQDWNWCLKLRWFLEGFKCLETRQKKSTKANQRTKYKVSTHAFQVPILLPPKDALLSQGFHEVSKSDPSQGSDTVNKLMSLSQRNDSSRTHPPTEKPNQPRPPDTNLTRCSEGGHSREAILREWTSIIGKTGSMIYKDLVPAEEFWRESHSSDLIVVSDARLGYMEIN